MLKWIRPGGAVVFAALLLIVGLAWWLLADWLLKIGIEKTGTRIVGAKVELAAADLSFSPLGFHLKKLQVTDPKQPMRNLVELDSTTGNLELLPLLMGQVIVDELSATGVRFHTKRTKSGAIEKRPAKKAPESKPSAADSAKQQTDIGTIKDKFPSVEEIMAKEPLATVKNIKALETQIDTQRKELEQNLAALPDEKKINQYQLRLKETTGGKIESLDDLHDRENKLEKLKDEIRADRDSLVKVRDQIKGAKDSVRNQYNTLKQSPTEDWNRLKARYGFDITGAGNITRLFFGDKAAIWLQRLLSWAIQIHRLLPEKHGEKTPEVIKPARGEGRFIRFSSADPRPDFLVHKALLTLELGAGNENIDGNTTGIEATQIELSVTDATHQPQILGRPMRLHASGKNLENAQHIQIDGVINHVNPENAKDSLQWSLSGWQLADVSLSKESTLPLTLTKARGNLSGTVQLTGRNLAADINASFHNTQWSSTAQENWQGRLFETITTVTQFDVDGQIQGDIDSPKMSIRSNLDEQLKNAITGQLRKAQAELEQKVKSRLNTEIETTAGPYKDHLAFLNNSQDSVDERINQLDEMLKAKLKSAVESQKQKATDQLKGKLKGLKF